MRPTYGLVSRFGVMPLSWTLDKIGPMGRSARDCGTVLEAIAGADRRDATSSRRGFRMADVAGAGRDRIAGLRIGYAPHDFDIAADAEIRPALRDGLTAVADIGASLTPVELPDLPYMDVIGAVCSAEGASVFGSLIESDDLERVVDPDAREGMRASLHVSARTYLNATRLRRRIVQSFRELFGGVDLLVTYTLPWAPTPIGERFTTLPVIGGLTGMVAASNLAGLPAAGLPVGIQLVAPPFREDLLVAVGERFEAATNRHRLRPQGVGSGA